MSARVAAILLAAGKSSRMGRCKQLLPLGDTTVIGRCLSTLQQGGANDIVVVISEQGRDVAAAVEEYGVQVVVNRDSQGDMASSVRAGRDVLAADISGVMVALCDYPLVTPATVGILLRLHAALPRCIITPTHRNRRGHPLLFDRATLGKLEEQMTLRDLIRQNTSLTCEVPVDDPGVLIDMDTPEDYARICAHPDCQAQ